MTLQHLQTAISTGLPPTMSVEDAAQLLGISRTMAYTEAARYRDTDGRCGLPNVRLGGRVLEDAPWRHHVVSYLDHRRRRTVLEAIRLGISPA